MFIWNSNVSTISRKTTKNKIEIEIKIKNQNKTKINSKCI